MEQPFDFFVPLRKSRAPESRHGEELWTIEGVAATEHTDQEGERLRMGGMDFSPFLKSGVINWNHDGSPGSIIGEPIEARVIETGGAPSQFFVKGFLYKWQKAAQDLWTHLNGLEKSHEATRGIGWSVQGGITERIGKELVKSVVRHVALTHEPVNAMTWATLAKSLAASNGAFTMGGVGIGEVTPQSVGEHHDLSPLAVQNLDGTLTKLLWDGDCDCTDPMTKSFRNGLHGLLDHLVLCRGLAVPEARALVYPLAYGAGGMAQPGAVS